MILLPPLIGLLVKISKALNDAQGSVEDFRRTAGYLQSVEIVLRQVKVTIETQNDGTTTLTPEDFSSLEGVINPLHALIDQLAAKVDKFAEFEGTEESLYERTVREFSKIKWEFMVKGEFKAIVEGINRQIALWATLWNLMSPKSYM